MNTGFRSQLEKMLAIVMITVMLGSGFAYGMESEPIGPESGVMHDAFNGANMVDSGDNPDVDYCCTRTCHYPSLIGQSIHVQPDAYLAHMPLKSSLHQGTTHRLDRPPKNG